MAGQLFSTFLAAVRSGDHQAAADFVRRWEPYIRQVIRRHLDARTRRAYDSGDICQSVLLELLMAGLAKAPSGEIRKRAATRARGKAIDLFRQEQRRAGEMPAGHDAVDPHPTPGQQALTQDLAAAARALLRNERERRIVELRSQGLSFAEIAAQVGGSERAVARMHQRACERLRVRLGKEAHRDAP